MERLAGRASAPPWERGRERKHKGKNCPPPHIPPSPAAPSWGSAALILGGVLPFLGRRRACLCVRQPARRGRSRGAHTAVISPSGVCRTDGEGLSSSKQAASLPPSIRTRKGELVRDWLTGRTDGNSEGGRAFAKYKRKR